MSGRNLNVAKVRTPVPSGQYFPDMLRVAYSAATAPCSPGFRIADNHGRVWYFAKTVEAVTHGNVCSHVPTEVAVAATKFDATTAGAVELALDITTTANAYQGGYLNITDGAGEGYQYLIASHTAGTAGSSDCTLQLEEPLQVALDATTTVGTLTFGIFEAVQVANAADPTVEVPLGVAAATSTTALPYVFLQTWGPSLVKAGTGAFGAGDRISVAEDDDGSAQLVLVGESQSVLGQAFSTAADTIWGAVLLQIVP